MSILKKIKDFIKKHIGKIKVISLIGLIIIVLIPVSYYSLSYFAITNFKTYESNLIIDKENNVLLCKEDKDVKILHISDIQIDNYKEAIDPFKKIKKLISKTTPDLIVLTGDNLDNSGEVKHVKKLASFMDSFNIPWAPVYGNHDYWAEAGIKNQNEIYENSKYCLFKTGDVINSNGNYYYSIKYQNTTKQLLIFMDSKEKGFSKEHTIWYEKVINDEAIKENEIIQSMLFFHIPIYELSLAYDQYLINPSVGSGFIKEPLSLQEENVGLFDKIVLLQSSKFIAFGHDHVNTLQIKFNDVMFCYGLKTGFTSYYDKDIQGGCVYTIKGNNEISLNRIYL